MCMVLGSVLFYSFTCSCPVFPALFVEEAVFAPLYILASFVKNKVPFGAWVYFWAFYLVPLVYISVFVPVPYCLERRMELEESTFPTSGYTTKPQLSRQYGTGTKTEI